MPQVVAVVAKVIFTVFSTLGASAALAKQLTAITLFALKTAAVAFAMRAFSPKPAAGAIDQGQDLRIKLDNAYPREVVIGTGAVGGTLEYATTSGASNDYLWRTIQISDVEINGVTEIWGNGKKLTFSGDWHTGYAACTSHFLSAGGSPRLWVRVYKGTASQTADADLVAAAPAGEWTTNSRGRGLAYAIVKKQYDTDAYKTGEPELFFVTQGALVRDPRTDTTAWSDNLPLIAGQFLRGFANNGVRVVGLGASARDVPDTQLGDAADIADELVPLAAGGTEKRYTGGGTISGGETARDVLTNLVGAMAGLHIDAGGEIVLLPGAPRSVVMVITDEDFLASEPVSYVGRRSGAELVNSISSTYVNPAASWQEEALPPRKDAAAITQDGDRYETQRAYRYCTSRTQGQRLDEIDLRKARKMGRLGFAIGMWGIELEPGDWFSVTSRRFGGGLQTKTFCVETTIIAVTSDPSNPEACVRISAYEIDATCFDWTTANEIAPTAGAVTRAVPALTISGFALTAATVSEGGASMPELRASWTAIANPAADSIEIEYRRSDDTGVVYRTFAAPTDTTAAMRQGVYAAKTYEARARINVGDRHGPWTSWDSEATPGVGSWAATDWRAMPANTAGGVSITRSVVPLSSSSSSSISVAAHDVIAPGETLSLPSATLSGLSTDTLYWVFWDRVGATYVATSSDATASGYYASVNQYVAVGSQRTQTSGGGYSPPPPPPPGYGGGGGGGYRGYEP